MGRGQRREEPSGGRGRGMSRGMNLNGQRVHDDGLRALPPHMVPCRWFATSKARLHTFALDASSACVDFNTLSLSSLGLPFFSHSSFPR